jgi:hypothetical protein
VTVPLFTGEASLYKTSNLYSMATTFGALDGSSSVYPQRVSGPFGPFGLPGQDCAGACLHLCMLSGQATQACINSCQSTCTGSPFATGLLL